MKLKDEETTGGAVGQGAQEGAGTKLLASASNEQAKKEKQTEDEHKPDLSGKVKVQGKKARLRIVGAQFINGGEALQMPILNSSNPDDLQAQLANFLRM